MTDEQIEKKRQYAAEYRKANAEKAREYMRLYYQRNKEELLEKMRLYYEQNIDAVSETQRRYYENNKEKRAEQMRQWRADNQSANNALKRKYQAAKLKRTPGWLTDNDLFIIEEAYELAALRAKAFGFEWHVDHIIPLQGKNVSGLHVPNNIQVIPATSNRRKNNRYAVQ